LLLKLVSPQNPWNLTISVVPPSAFVEDFEESGIQEITTQSPESSHSNANSTANGSSSPTDNSVSPTPTVAEPTIFSHKSDTQLTDVFERDGYTTTRTIIRPRSPRLPCLFIFSRPSSPVPGSISRPRSSLSANLLNLNCMGSTNGFEKELDLILRQRGQDIEVKVVQNQAVFYAKKWKDAIQAILFERTPPMVSCVGHIHGAH
jgi:hypothetical protein